MILELQFLYKKSGALLGNLTSPVIIIILLSLLFSKIRDLPAVKSAFMGIYPTIVALIAYAAYKIGKTAIKDYIGLIIMLLAFLSSLIFNVSPILLIVFGAVTGISISFIKNICLAGKDIINKGGSNGKCTQAVHTIKW